MRIAPAGVNLTSRNQNVNMHQPQIKNTVSFCGTNAIVKDVVKIAGNVDATRGKANKALMTTVSVLAFGPAGLPCVRKLLDKVSNFFDSDDFVKAVDAYIEASRWTIP